MLNKLETHVRRRRCRKEHLDNSLYPWKPAEAGSSLSSGCGKLSSTANPLTSGERAASWKLSTWTLQHPSPPGTGAHSGLQDCAKRERETERNGEGMIMLIASDRGTESDYRPTIAHVTLYPVSEKNLARLRYLLDQTVLNWIYWELSVQCADPLSDLNMLL